MRYAMLLFVLPLAWVGPSSHAQDWTAPRIIAELNRKRERPRIVSMTVTQKIRRTDDKSPGRWFESQETGEITVDFPRGRYRMVTAEPVGDHREHWVKVFDGSKLKGTCWESDAAGRPLTQERTAGIGTGDFRNATFGLPEFPYFLMFGGLLPEMQQYYPGHLFFPLDEKLFQLDRFETINGRRIAVIRTFPTGAAQSRVFNEYAIDPAADFGVVRLTQYRSSKADTKKAAIFDLAIELQKAGGTWLPKSWTVRTFNGKGVEYSNRTATVSNLDANRVETNDLFDIAFENNQKVALIEHSGVPVNGRYVKSKTYATAIDGQLVPMSSVRWWPWAIANFAVVVLLGGIVFARRRRSNRALPESLDEGSSLR